MFECMHVRGDGSGAVLFQGLDPPFLHLCVYVSLE